MNNAEIWIKQTSNQTKQERVVQLCEEINFVTVATKEVQGHTAMSEKKSWSGTKENKGYSLFSVLFLPLQLRFKMVREMQGGDRINETGLTWS